MALRDDLESRVEEIFGDTWDERDGYVVPDYDSLTLQNDAVLLDATVLYADMAESTLLVDSHHHRFAAEIYKAFLHCAAKVIRDQEGEVTAYDGDRVMAVFIGEDKDDRAVVAALKINNARIEIINPALQAQYPKSQYTLRHKVGIDTSSLLVARTGVRGANDLVWVGRAANHAAKLCTFSADYPTRITKEVYANLSNRTKYSNNKLMWEKFENNKNFARTYYRSSYHWEI